MLLLIVELRKDDVDGVSLKFSVIVEMYNKVYYDLGLGVEGREFVVMGLN